MLALASLLAVALVDPVTRPLSPTADNDAIYAEIAASNPALTDSPASLERLLAATQLADEKLRQAADADAASDLLMLTVGGLKVAYQRTGEAQYLCRLIDAADNVLAREGIPPVLFAAATDFRTEARDSLGATPCEQAPSKKTDSPPPIEAKPYAAPVGPALPPVARPVARPPADHRRVRAGLATLVPGLVSFAPMAGLLAYRSDGEATLAGIREDSKGRTLTQQEQGDSAALGRRYTATTAGAVALGVTGAVLVVTGASLLATGARQRRMAVAPWGARGVGGLVLQGRF
ncbi:hypothetical protein [Nannocystis sp.]|uniref:hypothetical protein n=1 Tax=Nannocystis sp. TaxID=1962667 RepID=UPI0025F5DCD0|nr:hypothetical protein [Nannocystis sp.]MBK7830736.1 hypothetical protein [Nannocystis sp.]